MWEGSSRAFPVTPYPDSGLADLPVEQPTKFELVVNLKAAKTLGPAIAQSILDEVVQ